MSTTAPAVGDTIRIVNVPGKHVVSAIEPDPYNRQDWYLAWLNESSHGTYLRPGEYLIEERAEPAVHDGALVDGDTTTVVLTAEEMAVIAAALAPEREDIDVAGIHSDVWPRLQDEVFPVDLFRAWAAKHGHPDDVHDGTVEGVGYDPEAGL